MKHVLQEVLKPKSISEGDYKHLIEYSMMLENNYSRLNSMNMEHEMSNTSTMSYKFPRSVREKWHACLLQNFEEERSKSFLVFILWLSSEKDISGRGSDELNLVPLVVHPLKCMIIWKACCWLSSLKEI